MNVPSNKAPNKDLIKIGIGKSYVTYIHYLQ